MGLCYYLSRLRDTIGTLLYTRQTYNTTVCLQNGTNLIYQIAEQLSVQTFRKSASLSLSLSLSLSFYNLLSCEVKCNLGNAKKCRKHMNVILRKSFLHSYIGIDINCRIYQKKYFHMLKTFSLCLSVYIHTYIISSIIISC